MPLAEGKLWEFLPRGIYDSITVYSNTQYQSFLVLSNDSFHAQALHAYMTRFHFHSDPLDVALRKLLMDVGLPRETQQIDRVMEAFAARYQDCNAGLFANSGRSK
jgi:Sec7-like guanine-nucleotide exchange factor